MEREFIVRALRVLGVRQVELANAAGLSRSTICRQLGGSRRLTHVVEDAFGRLARERGEALVELLDGDVRQILNKRG